MKLIDRARLPGIEVPYIVKRAFPGGLFVDTAGTQITFGEDYLDILEARLALQWLVEQMGGQVRWDYKTKDKK